MWVLVLEEDSAVLHQLMEVIDSVRGIMVAGLDEGVFDSVVEVFQKHQPGLIVMSWLAYSGWFYKIRKHITDQVQCWVLAEEDHFCRGVNLVLSRRYATPGVVKALVMRAKEIYESAPRSASV